MSTIECLDRRNNQSRCQLKQHVLLLNKVIYINASVTSSTRRTEKRHEHENSNNNKITVHLPIFPLKNLIERERKRRREMF